MILYSYFRSSASYRVRIGLNLKELEYEQRFVHLKNLDNRKEEYLQVNPLGQVPWLIDGDFKLGQSMAILQYLDRKKETPRLFPEDAKNGALVTQIAEIINAGIQPIQNLSVMLYLDEKYKVGAAGKFEWSKYWIERGFEALEKTLKNTSGEFSVGDNVTAADLFLVPQVYNAHRFKVDMEKFPTIKRINETCENIEAFAKAEPSQQPDSDL